MVVSLYLLFTSLTWPAGCLLPPGVSCLATLSTIYLSLSVSLPPLPVCLYPAPVYCVPSCVSGQYRLVRPPREAVEAPQPHLVPQTFTIFQAVRRHLQRRVPCGGSWEVNSLSLSLWHNVVIQDPVWSVVGCKPLTAPPVSLLHYLN